METRSFPEAPRDLDAPSLPLDTTSSHRSRRVGPITRRRVRWWWVVAGIGLAGRFVLAYVSRGTQDIVKWQQFAQQVSTNGLRFMYENVADYNHPPLMGKMAAYALALAQWTGLPFPFVFKLPAVFAEVLTTCLLWRIWRRSSEKRAGRASGLFALSLASILVSAYHGNTDCILAFFCLLSGYLLDRKRLYFLAGLALGAAINVKLIPVFCIPTLFVAAPSWRKRISCALGLGCAAAPFVPYLVTSPRAFYRNTLAYNSNFDNWGTAFLLNASFGNPRLSTAATTIADFWKQKARYAIAASVLLLCGYALLQATRRLDRSRLELTPLLACSLALFLTLTPGFGVQYTVYAIPCLFAVDIKSATTYSLSAGLFIGLIYWTFLHPGFPLYSNFDTSFPMPAPLVGLFAWASLGRFIVKYVRTL